MCGICIEAVPIAVGIGGMVFNIWLNIKLGIACWRLKNKN